MVKSHAKCFRNSRRLAREHGLHSIAFPAISCGVYGYPPDLAARVAVREILIFLAGNEVVQQVQLVAFDENVQQAWRLS